MKISWVSQLMVMQEGLKGVGVEHPDSWLMGGMGYAFVANAKPGLDPGDMLTYAGWNPERAFELGENLGFTTERVNARKGDPDFAAKQKEAWDGIRKALDAGYACYGFKMEIPEYSTIHGYDDAGYLYSGMHGTSEEAMPWQELGADDITSVLDVGWMRPAEAADNLTVVREALRFALDFSDGTNRWSVGASERRTAVRQHTTTGLMRLARGKQRARFISHMAPRYGTNAARWQRGS
jgi:hypothetical protein